MSTSLPGVFRPLVEFHTQLCREIDRSESDITHCKSAGLTKAMPSLLHGKYMYLVYPRQKNGKRRRLYVGKDPVKQHRATHKVNNTKLHRRLLDRKRALESLLQQFELDCLCICERYSTQVNDLPWKGLNENFSI